MSEGVRQAAAADAPFALPADAHAALERRIARAVQRSSVQAARTLASITIPGPAVDCSAVVLDARLPGDRYFCLERSDLTIAALGSVADAEGEGAHRFRDVVADCRRIGRTALAGPLGEDPLAPAGAGPIWVGGFAFAPDGARSPEWSSFGPARMTLPEISLARGGDETRLTLNVVCSPGDSPAELLGRAEARLATLRPAALPLLDPAPVGRARVASAAPPQHFESAIERAVERIAAGEVAKVVLAREVRVHAPAPIDRAAVFGALRDGYPSCFRYLVGDGEAAFLGASPELLVRREGQRVQTVALAGTRRRSADPAVDAHLGEQLLQSPKDREEQAIVTRRIARALEPVSVWVTAADEPALVRVLNVQHLATPIRAQLARSLSCVELAALLHPTPAVGGEPRDRALELIPALEGLDRGWYAGPLGWTDLAEDGELCVALRCALVRGDVAHLYAGEGIVRDSVAADELAANEAKLSALLPLLT